MFLDPRRVDLGGGTIPDAGRPAAALADRQATPLLGLFVRTAPVLWCLGLLQLATVLMLAASGLRRWPKEPAINWIVALWLACWLLQAASSVFNGFMQGSILLGIRNSLSLTSIGWLFGAFGLVMGAASARASRSHARQFAVLGLHTLVLGGATLLAIQAGLTHTQFTTPVGLLFGDQGMLRASATALFAVREETLGEVVPRLILMYPWPTATGIGSLGLLLISTRADGHWRWIGIAGGLVGWIFSWSRLAILSGAGVLMLLVLLRAPAKLRVSLSVMGVVAVVAVLIAANEASWLMRGWEAVNSARSGSSMAREMIYAESWRGFLESPMLGHGWVGESVHATEPLPIGSHSSILGTLYTGGVMVFSAFMLAMLGTLGLLLRRLRDGASPERRADREIALCLFAILAAAAFHEALYSLTLPCFFFFVWIGAALSVERDGAPAGERQRPQSVPAGPRRAFNPTTAHHVSRCN